MFYILVLILYFVFLVIESLYIINTVCDRRLLKILKTRVIKKNEVDEIIPEERKNKELVLKPLNSP